MTQEQCYEPIAGFFDLRNFNLTKSEFKSCWKIQKFLKMYSDTADYQRKHNKVQWEQAKKVSAELQAFLLPKLKEGL